MTAPSNAELRDAIYKIVDHATNQYDDGNDYAAPAVDELVKLFQAREQQLYKAIMGEPPYMTPDGKRSEKEMLIAAAQQQLLTELLKESTLYQDSGVSIEYVPVSVIERLQNKTNDGGTE